MSGEVPKPASPAPAPAATGTQASTAPPLDLDALAERVYRLMQEDLRLELARQGR